MGTQEVMKVNGSAITPSVNSMEITRGNEVAASALQAREVAMVQSRIMQALARPRDVALYQKRILRECERYGFADEAIYRRPQGRKKDGTPNEIFGLTIRFVERAIALYGNVLTDSAVVEDGEATRTIHVTVMDLETNVTNSVDMVVEKTVERKGFEGKPPKGRDVLDERFNDEGNRVFICRAYDDEIRQKVSRYHSFGYRNMGLKTLPADISAEAKALCLRTIHDEVKKNFEGVRNRLLDSFYGIGISTADIEDFLQHSISGVTGKEVEELRAVFGAIREGEGTWADFLDSRHVTIVGSREQQEEVAARKIAQLQAQQAAKTATDEPKGEEKTEGPSEQKDPKPPTRLNFGNVKK